MAGSNFETAEEKKQFIKIFSLSGVGWAFDAMDVIMIGSVIAALKSTWADQPDQLALIPSIVSVGFVGMALGAVLGGGAADKFGRKTVFAITLLLYGFATGLSAFAVSAGMLLVLRFFVGLGLGAELPVASSYVSEAAPPKIRGKVIVFLESFWAVGAIVAALIGAYIVPLKLEFGDSTLLEGWRVALAIGAIPAVFAWFIRQNLPESKAFEIVNKVAIEQTKPNEKSSIESEPKLGWFSLFNAEFRNRTLAIWAVWFLVNFAYYGAFTWMPTLLLSKGLNLTTSLAYNLIITLAQLPGYAVAAFLIEKIGRRKILAIFLVGSAISAGLFAFAANDTQILLFGSLLSFFNLGAWGALYAVTPEIYPTQIRGKGAGFAAGFGRIASIVAPFIVAWTSSFQNSGFFITFAIFAAVFVLAALAALRLPEFTGKEIV